MKVILTDYDPSWPAQYEQEKEMILKACGSKIHTIEHIGSTSVPGLGAKPIIDILLGVTELQNVIDLIPTLESLGYSYRSDFEHTMPYRRYFSKPDKVHIHSVEITSEFWRRHLLFRDYLRTHENTRIDYYKLKLMLAEKDWDDRNDYAYAKTEFVQGIEKRSLEVISKKCELTEATAFYDSYLNLPEQTVKEIGLSSTSLGNTKAMKTTSVPIILLNRVLGLGFDGKIDDELLNKLKKFYGDETKQFALQPAPHILTDESRSVMEKAGFKNLSYWARFYRTTESIINTSTGLTVSQIDKGEAETFGALVSEVYEMAPFKVQFAATVGRKNWKHFMAFEGNTPAAAAAMYIDKNIDTAWFGMAATKKKFRNRGAQSGLIAARIKAAKEAGINWLTVETGPDTKEHPNPSYKNILKSGFRLLYNRPNYIWKRE